MSGFTVDNISFTYPDGKRTVLKDLSLEIREGELLCLLGPSGCGKSTLLRLLSGLMLPDHGTVSCLDAPVTGPSTQRAMVFQNYSLFPWMTVQGNVMFAMKQTMPKLSKAESKERAIEWLEKVGLKEAAELRPGQLSGGMAQRAAIARALAMESPVLLLDEPFGALDERRRQELQELLLSLWQGSHKTVVFVTHDIDEALYLADRIIVLTHRGIIEEIPLTQERPRDREQLRRGEFAPLRQRLLTAFIREEDADAVD